MKGASMFEEITYHPDLCLECHEGIKPGDKAIEVKFDSEYRNFVHVGECWEKYKPYLFDDNEIKKGIIIGICGWCVKPVRNEQEFYVGRIYRQREGDSTADDIYSTYPGKHNGHELSFSHKECEDKAWEEDEDEHEKTSEC